MAGALHPPPYFFSKKKNTSHYRRRGEGDLRMDRKGCEHEGSTASKGGCRSQGRGGLQIGGFRSKSHGDKGEPFSECGWSVNLALFCCSFQHRWKNTTTLNRYETGSQRCDRCEMEAKVINGAKGRRRGSGFRLCLVGHESHDGGGFLRRDAWPPLSGLVVFGSLVVMFDHHRRWAGWLSAFVDTEKQELFIFLFFSWNLL